MDGNEAFPPSVGAPGLADRQTDNVDVNNSDVMLTSFSGICSLSRGWASPGQVTTRNSVNALLG